MEPIEVLRELHRATEVSSALLRESPEHLQQALELMTGAVARLLSGRAASLEETRDGRLQLVLTGPPLCEAEALVVGLFSQQASALAEQARRQTQSQKDLERKRSELMRLSRSSMLISSRLGLEETLQSILRMALEVTNARYGIFRLRDEHSRHLVTAAIAGDQLGRPLVEALPLEASNIMGWVATHRTSVLIPDLHVEPWVALYHPLDQVLEMRSELAVPLLGGGGRLEGVLNLESPEPGAFTQGDLLLLEAFASQAVVAIQHARLLDALQEIAERLLAWPCRKVLERLLQLARDLLDATAVAIHREGRVFLSEGSVDGGPWGRVLESPVRVGDNPPLGLLTAYFQEPSGGDWDAKILACLAHHAALAIENEERLVELSASQQRRAVAETFAAVGDLAANLLHQLNNKVGIIPVRIQGVEDKCRQAVEQNPYLARNLSEIRASAQAAMRIVRDNLGVLRSGGWGPVSLSKCVEKALSELGQAETMVVDFSGLEGLAPVLGEERSLVLIFWNLLDNAFKALGGKGEVRLTGRSLPETLEVRVADNGPGIPPERHEQIFELGLCQSGSENLGFGLWWVRTLMDRMGGSISVESDGFSGSVFVLRFPQEVKQ